MTWPTIHKQEWPGGVVPNVVDYDAARSGVLAGTPPAASSTGSPAAAA